MKLSVVILLMAAAAFVKANDPYRTYLLSKTIIQPKFKVNQSSNFSSLKTSCVIPRFERAKGAVFCRMEDYLTAKTKVWIKVGVR